MATVTSLVMPGEERYQINLGGTRAVFEYSRAYGVEHCIFVGQAHLLRRGPGLAALPRGGRAAARAQPLPRARRSRRRRPLRRDGALALPGARDHRAPRLLHARPDAGTARSRASFTASACRWSWGSTRCSSSCTRTTSCEAIVADARRSDRAASSTWPDRSRCRSRASSREAGRTPIPVPEFVLESLIGRFGFPRLPKGALTHIKYPVVVDAKAFREATGFAHQHDEIDAIASFRAPVGVPRPRPQSVTAGRAPAAGSAATNRHGQPELCVSARGTSLEL